MSQEYCIVHIQQYCISFRHEMHEYFVCEDVAREKRAFFLILVFRCKANLLQYTCMFSFAFVPFVLHAYFLFFLTEI